MTLRMRVGHLPPKMSAVYSQRLGKTSRIALAAALIGLLGACASAPATRWHSLLGAPQAQGARGAAAVPAHGIEIGSLSLPTAVQQPALLVRLSDGSLSLLEQERWVAPLGDELRILLIEALATLPGAAASAASPNAAWRLSLEVTRFDSVLGQMAALEARWSLRRASDGLASATCATRLEHSVGPGAAALVAGHQRAAAALAQAVVASIPSLTQGRGCAA